ncbi:uncharacterized protein UTRI_03720_B [Ustilago trichophora]|uniref:Uncharacterized protein n=1 Tax=Ustilago trichophora TaxID=86804 RepID=A0A5C3E2W1_9BASI|nr:uncharacterized protein UTRI_03720_B [Ustilago trichophora]
MLVYMSQYVDERSASPSPVPLKSPTKPSPPKSKKDKINFVSKASLAIFDPRHAMGIDTGRDWYDSDCHTPNSRSSSEHTSQRTAHRSEDTTPFNKWSTSPTPELEAFTGSMDDYTYTSSGAAGTTEMTRQPSASSSVFEDDRDVAETPSRRRFYSRKSAAPSAISTTTVASSYPTDDILFSPLGTKSKAPRSAGAGVAPSSASSSSSFARFFARKKKDKAPHLSGLASRSTPDLFDGVPQSAPPTTLTFEQSGFQFSPQRKASDSSSLHSSPSSLPTSPERQSLRLVNDFSPSRTSPLSKKKSMPALRQIREAHNALGAAQNRSIAFAMPEERSRPRQSMANSRNDIIDIAPALPPLPSFDTSSPMIPTEFAWDSKRGTVRESQMPSLGSNARPVSRVVSSTGRGVPSPSLNPIRLNDLRKSTITLRNEPTLRFAEDTRSQPSGKPTVGKSIASMRGNTNARSAGAAEKRMSMTQRVVDGLLDQNHGREEPEMRARRSDMEVKSARRRSRSADGRSIPSHKLHDLTSPPSSNSHADSVFPAFVRHAPVAAGRSNSPQPHFFADADSTTAATPTPKQAPSFATPTSASPNKSPIRNTVQSQSPVHRSPQCQNSGETHQARRVNFAGQRAKAVAVASPLLLSRSPLMAGRSGTPLPVVNIMPPTPDLAANDEHQERQEAVLQRYETVAAEATKVAQVAATSSSPVRAQGAPAGRVLPSCQETATPTPKAVVAVAAAAPAPSPAAPTKPAQSAPVMVMSPESVYSPASVYSPETAEGVFASLHAGLFGSDDAMSKEEMEITADSVAAELSYAGMPRTDSVASQLSEASSNRSSSSGAFAFSRSMSNSSLVSGGTFSSASSNASESPERKMSYLPSSTSFEFSPTKMSSSTSLASTAGTSIFELEVEMRGVAAGKTDAETDPFGSLGLTKLKTPFQLKGSSVGASVAQSASGAADSSDCDTPTLASCRQMGATAVPQQQQQKAAVNRQLGLSMDLSDLAQELGLGRLSQIGLAHLKGVESLADKPVTAAPTMTLVNAGVGKKISPVKPPKSSARATSTGAATGLSRFGAGMNDIASSAAMSPLPVSIAGRSPQTPPRTKVPLVEAPASGRKVSASGVPKAEGGFGLGLNFAESPSPQAAPRKAAITPGSYAQHIVEQTQTIPTQYHQPPHLQQQHQQQQYSYQEEEEAEWVGVAM